jgi:hypothetical protein
VRRTRNGWAKVKADWKKRGIAISANDPACAKRQALIRAIFESLSAT